MKKHLSTLLLAAVFMSATTAQAFAWPSFLGRSAPLTPPKQTHFATYSSHYFWGGCAVAAAATAFGLYAWYTVKLQTKYFTGQHVQKQDLPKDVSCTLLPFTRISHRFTINITGYYYPQIKRLFIPTTNAMSFTEKYIVSGVVENIQECKEIISDYLDCLENLNKQKLLRKSCQDLDLQTSQFENPNASLYEAIHAQFTASIQKAQCHFKGSMDARNWLLGLVENKTVSWQEYTSNPEGWPASSKISFATAAAALGFHLQQLQERTKATLDKINERFNTLRLIKRDCPEDYKKILNAQQAFTKWIQPTLTSDSEASREPSEID